MSAFKVLYCLFLLRRQNGKKGHYHVKPEGIEEVTRHQEGTGWRSKANRIGEDTLIKRSSDKAS